jgi:hypothetical protein
VHIISKLVVGRNGVVHCSDCNRSYCSTEEKDVLDHARHHAEFIRVTRNKRHVPCAGVLRDQLKDAGRELLDNAANDDDVRVAADMIVLGYYDRSFERSIDHGIGDLHPTLPEYARTVAEDGEFDPRVNAALLTTYPDAARASGTIDGTLWDPPAYVLAWAANSETN